LNIEIQLNDCEIEIGTSVAKQRYYTNRKNNTKYLSINQKTEADRISTDVEGVLSELAFCKIAQIYPDEVFRLGYTSKKNGGDVGDAFYKDKAIDVKSTKTEKGRLLSMFDNVKIDYYVLMIGEKGKYRLAGLMDRETLCNEKRWGHHGVFKRPCYKAEQDELISWFDFVKTIS
tara:strand:+ start:1761 stop:2282 length:522 start_codon:yes stop_codon:yes gene_type:complete